MSRVAATMCALILLATTACGGSNGGGPAAGTTDGAGNEQAFDAETYFAGRTIRVIVTHSAGGGTDLFARFIANEMGALIPGEPRVAVTNTPGLGGITTVFNAPDDADIVVGVTSQGSTLYTSALDSAATFDPERIQMIGALGPGSRSVGTFGEVAKAFPALADATGAEGPALKMAQTIGSPADIVSDAFFFSWTCENMNLPCEGISVADDDSSDLSLMMERGELNTILTTTRSMVREYLDGLIDGTARIAVEYALDDTTTLTLPQEIAVPSVLDVLPANLHEEYDRILPIISAGSVGNNFWAGPTMPAEATEVLRQAFTDLLSDPDKLTELRSIVLGGETAPGVTYEFAPMSGADAQQSYLDSADTFSSNLDYYQELQDSYYKRYWSS